MDHVARLKRLRAKMEQEGVDTFLVCSQSNVRYLSGFSGSNGWLWVTRPKAILLTDFRYEERAKHEAPCCEVRIAREALMDEVVSLAAGMAGQSIGFESAAVPFRDYAKLKESLPDAELRPTEHMVEALLEVKDDEEIAGIQQAVRITDRVFEEVLPLIRPELSERDLAAEIEYKIKKLGGDKPAFDTIVASGENGAMPHAATSDKSIERGDFVTLDMGAYSDGYASDLTRTVVVGEPTARQQEIYDLVLAAQEKAIAAARGGMPACELDAVARDFIRSAGYGEQFGHGLGHGVGLLVHDPPKISWTNAEPLRPGMVVTIEPGIYLPGWGGVRIEDVVVIREDGCDDLTSAPKRLISV